MISINRGIIWIIINLGVLTFFLNKFLYKPVNNLLAKRQDTIVSTLQDADDRKAEAAKLKSDYEEEIKNAGEQASAIIKEARERAEIEYNKKIQETKNDVAQLLAEATKTIELEKKKSMESAQAEIAGIALLAASKILGKNVDDSANKQFVGDFLKEVGAAE